MQTREKISPEKSFQTISIAITLKLNRVKKIQNILPFSLRKQILEREVETLRWGESEDDLSQNYQTVLLTKTQELCTIKMNKKLLLILLSKSSPLFANKISQLRKQNRRKAFIYGVLWSVLWQLLFSFTISFPNWVKKVQWRQGKFSKLFKTFKIANDKDFTFIKVCCSIEVRDDSVFES